MFTGEESQEYTKNDIVDKVSLSIKAALQDYIKKNKGNNISSYDITQEEANKITYKYFGVKDIDISKEDDNFSIKKKNNGYTISWKSTSCGFKKYEITELYYEENIVKLKVEEFSLNENNEYETIYICLQR